MAITVEDGTFYVVSIGDGYEIHKDRDGAISSLSDSVENVNPDNEEYEITEVKVGEGGEDWALKQLPWRDIALQLLKGE